MFNTISSSLQHTIPTSIFSTKGFPHLHTITNHLISSLKDQDLKKMKELKDKIKSLPFDELTEEELLTPSLSTIIERALEEFFPDNIYNHPDFPGLFYISSNLSKNYEFALRGQHD